MDIKEQAQKRYDEARAAYAALAESIEARIAELPEDASVEDVDAITVEATPKLQEAKELVERTKAQAEQMAELAAAREATKDLIPARDIVVKREAPVYSKDPFATPNSYFNDLYRAQKYQSPDAIERLQRNSRMTEDELQKRGLGDVTGAEARALSSSGGGGGDFLPPLYFGDLYAYYKRASRVTSRLVRQAPLAAHGNTITIPRVTGGTATAAQQDNATVQVTDATTALLTVSVCTIAGGQDMSRQIVERSEPGLDEIILADLMADYNKRLNLYVVNGSGSAGQPTGLLTQGSTNAISFTGTTVDQLYPKILDGVRQITENVFEPTAAIVMTARRWAWILAGVDSSKRPFAVSSSQGPYNALGLHSEANASFLDNLQPAGSFAGYPVYIDETIPKNLGTGTNEDRIILAAFNEHILWEDPAGPRQFTFEGVASATAAIRVQVFGYFAFTAGRYPAATSVVSGTGLATPTF